MNFRGNPFAVVGLFKRGDLYLSIARKGDDCDLGFPGGKVEPGEDPDDALVREIREEVGVELVTFKAFDERLDKVGRLVRAYLVTDWTGEPRSMEGPPVAWVKPLQLTRFCCSFRGYNMDVMSVVSLFERRLLAEIPMRKIAKALAVVVAGVRDEPHAVWQRREFERLLIEFGSACIDAAMESSK